VIPYLFRPLYTRRLVERALDTALRASEGAAQSHAVVERALELISRLEAELERLRPELAVYRLGTMEADAQTAELERMMHLPNQ
jgi:hypothetical protein